VVLGLALSGCVGIGPDYFWATEYRQAEILFQEGFIPQAREKTEALLAKAPGHVKARALLKDINTLAATLSTEHVEMAEAYEKAGLLKKTIHEYNAALRYNPSNKWARKKLALLGNIPTGDSPNEPPPGLEVIKKEIRKAKKAEIGPEKKAARHYVKGKLYFISAKYNKAIKHFTAALKDMPDYKDADVFLRLARLERQNMIDYHTNQGVIFFQKEELKKAIKEWNIVISVDPANAEAADYKKRAEVIEKKVKKIKAHQNKKEQPKKAKKKKRP